MFLYKTKIINSQIEDIIMNEDVNLEENNKRKGHHLSPPPYNTVQKRYLWTNEELLKNNKFYNLPTEQVSDAGPSSNMPSTSSPKIPPIFLSIINYNEMIIDLKRLTKNDFLTKTTNGRTKINVNSIEDYRTITNFFKENQINFYTYQDSTSKPLSIVIKNVPYSIEDEDIKKELLDKNLPVTKVSRLLNKNKAKSLVVAVELVNKEAAKEIFKIEHLCYAVVHVEPRKNSGSIPQCFRCQRYGHTKNYCEMNPRCVKCEGDHLYKDCAKSAETPPKCVNCKMDHPANYKGCAYYLQQVKNNKNKYRSPRTVTNTNPVYNQLQNQNISSINTYSFSQTSTPRSYANVTRSNTPSSTIPNITTQNQTSFVEQILNFILSLITPHIEQIKNFFMSHILPGFFNGQP